MAPAGPRRSGLPRSTRRRKRSGRSAHRGIPKGETSPIHGVDRAESSPKPVLARVLQRSPPKNRSRGSSDAILAARNAVSPTRPAATPRKLASERRAPSSILRRRRPTLRSAVHALALTGRRRPPYRRLDRQPSRRQEAPYRRDHPKVAARKGRKLDFAALAEELQVQITAFDAALQNVKREEREAEQALTKRDAAVAAFEPVYTGISDLAAGLLELVGQSDLASRVKPTVRRRAGLDLPAADPVPEVPLAG